ncbi:hypothetical protein D3C74_483600 [compost metagenome]
MVQHLHKPIATGARCVLVEQVQLSHALTEEVTKHDPRLLVPVTILPDGVKTFGGRVDNVPAVLRGRQQLY